MRLTLSRNLVIVAWLAIVGASAAVNLLQWRSHLWQMGYQAAEGFFRQVLVTRRWNALHGRVYVPVSATTRPNSYLEMPGRDIPDPNGQLLTLVNPAYMTRQLSELAARGTGVHFRITSLDPVRPQNAPTSREQRYLRAFEGEAVAGGEIIDAPGGPSFFYMAPLVTEEACLECHEKQGYRVGDVRGGVSVEVPYVEGHTGEVIVATHATLFAIGLSGIFLFFSRLGEHVDRVEHEAGHDGLTGVLNRKTALQLIEREFRRSRRSGSPLCVLMIDVDDFKPINDSRGHPAGDRCLVQLADALGTVAGRAGDLVGRYGGEEFIVALPDTPLEAAALLAERIRYLTETTFVREIAGAPLHMTVSIGIAQRAEGERDLGELIKRADDALYQAKRRGKNRVCSA